MPTPALRVAAAIAAAVAFVCGAAILFWVGGFLSFFVVETVREGSGGLGAVSAGVSEALVVIVLAVPVPVVLNRLLRRWARSTEGAARRLHRLHSIALWLFFGFAGLAVALLMRSAAGGGGLAIFNLFIGVWMLYAVQFLLLGVVLALYARS